jgi:amino-acid N-acetyltransferase
MGKKDTQQKFIDGFRHSAPYIHAHRDRTFVIAFGGEAIADHQFAGLVHDIALLHGLGIRLVLVHGARPQIEQKLNANGSAFEYVNGLRITDDAALTCVKEAAGTVRVEIEALLSMGLANTPMSGARIGVTSGNFIIARPLGIHNGVDYCHTGEVRRVEGAAIRQHLADRRIVLLSPLGYSPTGEVFNLSAEEIATATASELHADKLILLTEGDTLRDSRRRSISQLTLKEATTLYSSKRKLPASVKRHLQHAIHACQRGVRRVHLLDRQQDGALLLELFTRDGLGTLITADAYDDLRVATINDVGGILELIKPLEEKGILVKRSRERLEMEIDHFLVLERDGTVIACAAFYPCEQQPIAELACLAVHTDYLNAGHGETVLKAIEAKAIKTGIHKIVVLTTRTAHWFREHGFLPGDQSDLPARKKLLYNYRRNSKVFYKLL